MKTFLTRLRGTLDPGDSLGEILFGLIMVLTFTLGTRLLADEEPLDAVALMVAALGCNIAWGIIDGFLFILAQVYERRRRAALVNFLRNASTEEAHQVLAEEISGGLAELADPAERHRFCDAVIAAVHRSVPTTGVQADDIRGAIVAGLLVIATALPPLVTVLLIEDDMLALRVSNALLVALLFLAGWFWGKRVGARPWHAGLMIMLLGAIMALVAIPLGG